MNGNDEQIKHLIDKRNSLIRVRKSLYGPDKRSRYQCAGFNRMDEIERINAALVEVEQELIKLGHYTGLSWKGGT